MLYFGTTPSVSYLTATSSINIFTGGSQAAATTTSTWTMSRANLLDRGFSAASGTTAYAVACGTGQGSFYNDLVTGLQLTWSNPNLTPSPVVSFTMP